MKTESIPDWVLSLANGEINGIYQNLNIDKENYKVFTMNLRKNSKDDIDLKKESFINTESEIWASIERKVFSDSLVAELWNLVERGLENQETSRDFLFTELRIQKHKIENISDEKLKIYFINNETGKEIPYAESSEHELQIFTENFDEIINLLFEVSPIAKAMKLEAEYFVFSENKINRNILVDSGTSDTTKSKYDMCDYFSVFTIPIAIYDKVLSNTIELFRSRLLQIHKEQLLN